MKVSEIKVEGTNPRLTLSKATVKIEVLNGSMSAFANFDLLLDTLQKAKEAFKEERSS